MTPRIRLYIFSGFLFSGFLFLTLTPQTILAEETRVSSVSATDSAVFAGGCFWCVEAAFEKIDGVKSVTSGYIGGTQANSTYQKVSAGVTKHAEAVEVRFDPKVISYEKLLGHFWKNIDPFAVDRQFCDRGKQYRAGIFFRSEEQEKLARASKEELVEKFKFTNTITTEITKASEFYPAEEYHQDYYKKNPIQYKSYALGCGRARRLRELWGKH